MLRWTSSPSSVAGHGHPLTRRSPEAHAHLQKLHLAWLPRTLSGCGLPHSPPVLGHKQGPHEGSVLSHTRTFLMIFMFLKSKRNIISFSDSVVDRRKFWMCPALRPARGRAPAVVILCLSDLLQCLSCVGCSCGSPGPLISILLFFF